MPFNALQLLMNVLVLRYNNSFWHPSGDCKIPKHIYIYYNCSNINYLIILIAG